VTFALDQVAHAGIQGRSGTTRFRRLTHASIEPETRGRGKTENNRSLEKFDALFYSNALRLVFDTAALPVTPERV